MLRRRYIGSGCRIDMDLSTAYAQIVIQLPALKQMEIPVSLLSLLVGVPTVSATAEKKLLSQLVAHVSTSSNAHWVVGTPHAKWVEERRGPPGWALTMQCYTDRGVCK